MMIAISPSLVTEIDRAAEALLGLSVDTLMGRAGDAVAEEVARRSSPPATVLLLCGKQNNGGDGYAAALALFEMGYTALAVDVFGAGQASDAGNFYLAAYKARIGEPLSLREAERIRADILVDAVLGTGARLPLYGAALEAAHLINRSTAYKIAVDLPLGVDAESGECDAAAVTVDVTVALGFHKIGLFSYPARACLGKLVRYDLGLDTPEVREKFALTDSLMAVEDIPALLPKRDPNTHKGSFGHLLILAGSHRYRGAALLATASALRMGAGLTTLASCEAVLSAAAAVVPEAILAPAPTAGEAALTLSEGKRALLIGPGYGVCPALAEILAALLANEGCPVVLDADALTALSEFALLPLLKSTKRKVILTPHPGEFARLVGLSVAEVQRDRLSLARRFAAEYPVTLLLKGAGSITAEGEEYFINTTGSPALAKGGSGDVLAGAIASLIASGCAPRDACRLAACLHGAAGERAADAYSELGVRPSDLPLLMAEILGEVTA